MSLGIGSRIIAEKGTILIREARAAFVKNLWVAQKRQDPKTGNESFSHSVVLILPPDHVAVALVKEEQRRVASEQWPNTAQNPNYTTQILQGLLNQDKTALHDGNNKAQFTGYAGNVYLNCHNPTRPTILDVTGRKLETRNDCRIYSGAYVNAEVQVWAQDNAHGKRVNVQLFGIQFLRDGDSFSGGGVSDGDAFGNEAEGGDPWAGQQQAAGGGLI